MAVNAAVDPSFDDLDAILSGTKPAAMAPAEVVDPNNTAPVAPPTPPAEPPATEPAAAEPAQPAEATETGEPAATDPVEATPPATEPEGKPGWVDKRLSSLAAKRREAEQNERIARQQANDSLARAERAERELETLRAGNPPAAQAGQPAARPAQAPAPGVEFDEPKPLVKDFVKQGGKAFLEGEEYDDGLQRHADALDEWRDKRRAFEDAKTFVESNRRTQEQTFVKDIDAAMQQHPEFEDSRDFVVSHSSESLQIAISNLPRLPDGKAVWPQVVMHLADNPDVLASIEETYKENPYAATAELGRIMAGFVPATGRAKAAAPAAAAPPVPAATPRRAPAPPKTVGGNAAPAPVSLDDAPDMESFARVMKTLVKA